MICPPKERGTCPAREKICSSCNKKGHFAAVCFSSNSRSSKPQGSRSKGTGQVKKVSQNSVRDADTNAAPQISIKLSSHQSRAPIGTLQVTSDTGAEASIIGIQEIRSLDFDTNKLNPPAKDKLIAANGQFLKCIGTLPCIITYVNRTAQDVLHVCHKIEQCLLAWYTCRNLGILPPNYPEPIELHAENNGPISGIVVSNQRSEFKISHSPSPNKLERIKQTFLNKYEDVFNIDGQLRETSDTPMKIF